MEKTKNSEQSQNGFLTQQRYPIGDKTQHRLDKLRRARRYGLIYAKIAFCCTFCLWLALGYIYNQSAQKSDKLINSIKQIKHAQKTPTIINEKGDIEWAKTIP